MMHDSELQRAFRDWKDRANERGLLEVAVKRGAKLKKTGQEWVGPCPVHGGKDRFAVNEPKGKWICRGNGGGADAISLAMHLDGSSFSQACQDLTGEPPPAGQARPLTEEERAERERRRAEAERAHAARQREEERRREESTQSAIDIWREVRPIENTPAEVYLLGRGIPKAPEGWPNVIGFHPGLVYYPDPRKPTFPCLVARVDNAAGELIAVWRIYLTAAGGKAPYEKIKLGLGPAAGGAVRLGGVARKIGLAEGLETTFGVWWLRERRHPVWSVLSTSGLMNVELPLEVEEGEIFPDGDRARLSQDMALLPPPGISAARKGRDRLADMGLAFTIAKEPAIGRDYLDIWNTFRAREGL